MTSEVHFDDLLGGEGDDGAILLRPQELGRQVTQVEVGLTLLGAAGNLKISDENILVILKKLHLSLLPIFLKLTCLSVTSVSADWLLDWSLAAKWARLPITYLAAAYPTQTNFFLHEKHLRHQFPPKLKFYVEGKILQHSCSRTTFKSDFQKKHQLDSRQHQNLRDSQR